MAYPTVDKPYGLKPINLIGGQVFAGATRSRRIDSGEASIGYGDPVTFTSSGTITVSTATSATVNSGLRACFWDVTTYPM